MEFFKIIKVIFIIATSIAINAEAAPSAAPTISPHENKILIEVSGIKFDIPKEYFYENYQITMGKWPTPRNERKSYNIATILAYIPGMQPWSPELEEEFRLMGERQNILRITINGNSTRNWLNNYLSFRVGTQRKANETEALPNLEAFKSDLDTDQTYYLKKNHKSAPPFIISCKASAHRYCDVTFTYKNKITVNYLLSKRRLKKWEPIHHSTIALLDSLISKKEEK